MYFAGNQPEYDSTIYTSEKSEVVGSGTVKIKEWERQEERGADRSQRQRESMRRQEEETEEKGVGETRWREIKSGRRRKSNSDKIKRKKRRAGWRERDRARYGEKARHTKRGIDRKENSAIQQVVLFAIWM